MSALGLLRTVALAATVVSTASLVSTSCTTPDVDFGDGASTNLGGAGPVVSGHCANRTPDADETDTDCGGIDCSPCALGRRCDADSDCAESDCNGGKCQAASCTDGEKNGTETDVDCGGGEECAACGPDKVCTAPTDCQSGVCSGGRCAEPSCSDRVKNGTETDVDCGGDCDGCDVGDSCVVTQDCVQPTDIEVDCSSGMCELICETSQADCNDDASDGCETNLNSSIDHCGGCDVACNRSHVDVAGGGLSCNGGNCQIAADGCVAPWDDANNDPNDGCEVNTNSDPDYCGQGVDQTDCSDNHGTPSCSNGECGISCDANYADCENGAADGCETNVLSNVNHCGGCNMPCTPNPGESASCNNGTCESIPCSGAMACGGSQPCGACSGDQMCDDLLTTTSNCGGCGISCTVANGIEGCTSGDGGFFCEIAACTQNATNHWEDCDGLYVTGCERDLLSDKFHCGACGNNCSTIINDSSKHVGQVSCQTGGCVITACEMGYADCDGTFANGCEVNVLTDDVQCGGCTVGTKAGSGVNCTTRYLHGSGNCNAGTCELVGCNSNWGDCNGDGAATENGCETDLRITEAHCGSCGNACDASASTTASNTCTNSACVPSCSTSAPVGADCDTSRENGCETPLGTTLDCASCGDACDPGEFCTPLGCRDHLIIEKVNDSTTATGVSNGDLAFTHDLATSRTTNDMRAVLVLVGSDGNTTPSGVTYAGTPMQNIGNSYSGNQSWTGIFFLGDTALPATAGTKNVVVEGDSSNSHGHTARVIELTNVDQSAPFTAAMDQGGNITCDVSLTLTSLSADSWVFSTFAVAGGGYTFTVTGAQTAYAELEDNGTTTVTGYTPNVSGSSTVGWSCASFNLSLAHVAVAIQPEGTD